MKHIKNLGGTRVKEPVRILESKKSDNGFSTENIDVRDGALFIKRSVDVVVPIKLPEGVDMRAFKLALDRAIEADLTLPGRIADGYIDKIQGLYSIGADKNHLKDFMDVKDMNLGKYEVGLGKPRTFNEQIAVKTTVFNDKGEEERKGLYFNEQISVGGFALIGSTEFSINWDYDE